MTTIGPAHARARPGHRFAGRSRRKVIRRRRIMALFLVLIVLMTPIWWSLGSALTTRSLGTSVAARFAEWAHDHGAGPVVRWAENVWYTHHAPPKGGRPPAGAIPVTKGTTPAVSPQTARALPVPAPVVPPASPPLPGEGQWHPAGRLVNGVPAVYEAFVRVDPVHTSFVAGIAWMDTRLLRATLYSGSSIPGGGPYRDTAPITSTAATSLVAAFNAGFRMPTANGGYYTDGKTVLPLRTGAASFVIYKNGSVAVGAWGSDVTMTPQVVSVRQNLDLVVNGGKAVPGLNSGNYQNWGLTLGNNVYVWRSGVGETANGALVYVGGPYLSIATLANLLVRAGAVRAMELDINTTWVNYATFSPPTPNGVATATNGTDLLSTMAGTPGRYFATWWTRDFFTMSAAPTESVVPPATAQPAAARSSSSSTAASKTATTARPSG